MKFFFIFSAIFWRISSGIFEVAVIGGGIAGLSAARNLLDLVEIFNVTLFEANFDRIGGRILSQKFAADGLKIF